MSIIEYVNARIRKFRKHSRLPARKLCGTEKHSGQPFSILYAGTPSQMPFVRNLLFSDMPSESDLGSCFSWSVNRMGERHRCDLAVAVQSITARSLLPKAGYCLPLWLESIADTTASPYESREYSMRRDLKRVKRNDLRCVEATSREEFEFFWERMYVPHANARFGDAVQLENEENFFAQVDADCLKLFFVAKDGELLGGGTVSLRGTMPRYRYLGILDSNKKYFKLGVAAGAYIFMLDWAYRNGYPCVNMGGTRPFLRDGVLQFKKKYNVSLVPEEFARVLYINPLSTNTATTACLVHNPIIRMDEDGLAVTIFEHPDFDVSVPDSLWQYQKQVIGGLNRVERVSLP